MEDLQRKIFSALQENDLDKANNDMCLFCSTLSEDLSSSSIDAYISLFFTKGASVMTYLQKVFDANTSNNFNEYQSITSCLSLIYMLLKNFPAQMSDHISSIITMSCVMISEPRYSKFKQRNAEILYLIISSKEIEVDEKFTVFIYGKIKTRLSNDKSTYALAIYIQIMGAFTGNKYMKLKIEEIANIILNFIKNIPGHKTGVQSLLQGGYNAAHELMAHTEFTSEQILLLYQYMKRDVLFNEDLGRRQGSRAVVDFTAANSESFGTCIQNDVQIWTDMLYSWFNSQSNDDSKSGYEALISVYRAVGNAWSQTEDYPQYFPTMLDNAKEILEKNNNDNETKLAIYTIGFLAPTAAKFMTMKNFRDLFLFLLQRIEYLIFVKTDSNANVLTANSCDYVEAISPFLETLKTDIQLHINQFKRVTIILIKMFPNILVKKHDIVVKTLRSMFKSISSNAVFHDFVKDVVKQGVIWTCSHHLAEEVEILNLDEVTYKKYLPLWQGILHNSNKPVLEDTQKELWNQLIKNLLYMSDKLDLRILIDVSDNSDQMQPQKCNDLVIFANLSDFYCDLLNFANAECMKPWLDTLCDHMIRKSMQLPLISGFYKIMATVMKLFDKVDHFHQKRVDQKEHVRVTYENVKNYFQHTLKQVHRFKNDLQMSCVLLILHMPMSIVKSIHYDYSGFFIAAFKLGQHNFSLANEALDTLSKWYHQLPEDVSFDLLKKVVPCLDAYLRNQFVVGDSFHVEGRKLKKYSQRKLDVEVEPELVQLQHKVLKFLAIVPNEICLELNSISGGLKLTKSDTKLLKVNLPFAERCLSLYLDPFLDRVLILSIECTDRKVRITACELLHSIVIVFLGTSKLASIQNSANESDPQLERILSAILRLASDQDTTVVSLFNPLLLQMAHWYAHPLHTNSTHAEIFIKTLMDGVSNENDGAVRDISGNILREFIAWTRKQNSKMSLKININNVKLIIAYLIQFCLHPDEAKRFGATVIFNNIYRELREEDTFVDFFWLEILYAFVMNLSLVTPATNDNNLLNEINLCLDRVTRCLLQKHTLFTRVTTERRTPPKFNGNTFDDAALFLLQHTWQINTHCRTKCMEIFKKLPSETLVKALGHYDMNCYMHDLHTTPFFHYVTSIEDVLRYFASLTCFIDGYIFITELSPSFDHSENIIWSILDKLIEDDFKKTSLKDIQKSLDVKNDVLVRRIKDEFVYYRAKLVEKILSLYEVANSEVINENVWNFLADFIFDYHKLGLIDLTHKNWEDRATKLIKLFMDTTKFNSITVQVFALTCKCAISKIVEMENHLSPDSEVEWSNRQILKGLIVLQRIDKHNELELPQVINSSPLATILNVLRLDKMEDDEISTITKLKDSQREYFTLKLEMMLDEAHNPDYNQDFDLLLKSLCCEQLVYSTESNTTLPQGVVIFLLFKKTILKHTVQENRLFTTLGTIANESSIELRVKYFKEYLKYIYNTPVLKNNHQIKEELVKSIEYIWPRKQADIEMLSDADCMELIYDLRLIVDELSCLTMLDTVAAILKRKQVSDTQQVHHLTQVVRVLGMVAPRGISLDIARVLYEMKADNLVYFQAQTKRVTTTLFIKTLFDATHYSYCLNFFITALDFYIILENDFEVDTAFCKEFMSKLPKDLQAPLINEIFGIDNEYTFKQRIVLALCLCNIMAYCEYEVFEDFYVRNISIILEGFSMDSVMSKTVSCIMLNRLFGNINVDNFANLTCKITKAACATVNTGRELISRVATILISIVKDHFNPGDDPEEFRLYQCYAYNAFATFVCNARMNKEFYSKLFIRLGSDGEDILWTKLVPLQKSYDFEIVADDIPKKKKTLSDIRTQITTDIKPTEYIESQNLFLSTLAEDITNYDFTNVCVRYEEGNRLDTHRNDAMALEIYDEDINKHECMLQICAVIKHMYEHDLLQADVPPKWVYDFTSMLFKGNTAVNIRQYLCKVIENSQEYLKQYAHILIPGVIRTICETCKGLNSLASDCVVMLLTTWSEHSPCRDDVQTLIQYLMINLWNYRTDVFKYNVNLLKTTIETYKTFELPDGLLTTLFADNVECKSNKSVIHIINILLVNNISPFPSKLKTFCTKMCKLLTCTDRLIYTATAETLGLALKFLDENGHSSLTPFKKMVTDELQAICSSKDNTKGKTFVYILESVVKNYPDISATLLTSIERLIAYRTCTEISKTAYLRIYLKCIDRVCETGLINRLSLTDWVSSSSLDTVILTLEIILHGVDYFDGVKAEALVEKVVNLPNNNTVCRSIRIDILNAFYKRFYQGHDNRSAIIRNMVKEPLINAFVEVEQEIRNKVYAFWTGEDMLPSNLEEKLLYLLENLYDKANEELFLTFCNFLMLHDLKDFDQPIFPDALYKCDFHEYEVSSHWRSRNSAMMPLYTASSQSQGTQGFYLRATQSYEFEQTQQLATQRQSYTQSASAMTFGNMPESTRPDNNQFKNPNDLNISIPKVKKWRFFKNKADVSRQHAIREIRKGQNIEKQKHDAKKMKEVQVKIYRKYRSGDFPDIQIGIKAVTDPLKELSKNDGHIAQLLYKSLFDAIIDTAISENFLEQGNTAIRNILATSAMYDPVCMGAFLQIALEHKHKMRFTPDLIKTVATKSGNLSYGCLLLEEYLINREGSEIEGSTLHWIRLADLYKKMEEWDVVQGIFANKMSCTGNLLKEIKMAVKCESENYWDTARKHYLQLIQKDSDVNRKDFYYESYFKCSEELSDWQEIEKRCAQTTRSNPLLLFDSLWVTEWNKEILLPYYIKSQVRMGDNSTMSNKPEFTTMLFEAMKDGGKKLHLRNEFSDELALLYLDKLRIKLAGSSAENHAKRFLKLWKFTQPSYTSMQNKMILAMKNTAEISVLLELYDNIDGETYEQTVGHLETLWTKSNVKDSVIPTQHLITRITLRESFVNLTKLKLQTLLLDEDEVERMSHKLSALSFGAEVNIIQKALQQKNLHLAKYYARKNCNRTDTNGLDQCISWLLYSKVVLMRTDFPKAFKGHHKCITQLSLIDEPSIAIDAALHLTDLCKSLVDASEKYEIDLGLYRPFVTTCTITRFTDLLSYSFENLRDTLYDVDRHEKVNGEQLADAFLNLANEYAARGGGYENRFIECSLKSMKYGSEKARLVFPKLLAVDGLRAIHKTQFIQQSSSVPIYMFISWIPQLLAYCDTDKVSVIKHIVISLAKEYPNSIIYAYKLSRAKFTYDFEETRDLTIELDDLLHNELVDKMLAALKYVAVPSTIMKTALDKLKKACKESQKAFTQTAQEVVALFNNEDDAMLRGECYQRVIECKDELLSIINYSPFDEETIFKKLCDFTLPSHRSNDLGHYSLWLKDFHASDYEQEIEVPGCYTGNCRPLPHYHPKISKFSTDVKVFQSLQRPIRISIYANDIKEYRFLVKYGEDLRQDQRIQQLFKLMNVVLSADVKCRERKLTVSTFEVIPLTAELGFIQWVDETDILRNVITNRSGYPSVEPNIRKLKETHRSRMNLRLTSDEIRDNYNQLVDGIPWDALRKSLWNMAPDPEAFFALRMTFIRSYAVMCITNWLLGIGDRHLDNILLNMDTGNVIGIDFGRAFGSATQQQLIPELVPFRLTPQILNVMMPLKENGLLHQAMVHSLRVLRENCDILLSTMDIFIVEPTLNWLTFNEATWNPSIIMQLAKSKFQGKNSISIMIEEVKARQIGSPDDNNTYIECLETLLDTFVDDTDDDDQNGGLSVHGQVKCLITHATDANLLGRMFYGWDPWV